MIKLNIKPMSVNRCWQGRRFKTPEYRNYEMLVCSLLPKFTLPDPPYSVTYSFGFSNSTSDIDNPVKPFTDILQKYYGFNDKLIYKLVVEREKVGKGKEFIRFDIRTFTN